MRNARSSTLLRQCRYRNDEGGRGVSFDAKQRLTQQVRVWPLKRRPRCGAYTASGPFICRETPCNLPERAGIASHDKTPGRGSVRVASGTDRRNLSTAIMPPAMKPIRAERLRNTSAVRSSVQLWMPVRLVRVAALANAPATPPRVNRKSTDFPRLNAERGISSSRSRSGGAIG